jgi:hypothetical protein
MDKFLIAPGSWTQSTGVIAARWRCWLWMAILAGME